VTSPFKPCECPPVFDRPSAMWIEPDTEPHARATIALTSGGHVVSRGVRHVPIDVLPRDVLTFRTICGQDVNEDQASSTEPIECTWCRRFGGPSRFLTGRSRA
jgi:hypothetical protein